MGTPIDRTKHLEMIQAVITRLAGNSFLFKGWSATIITIAGALVAKDKVPQFAWLLLLPAFSFLFADAYYLTLERSFRRLFTRVAKTHNQEPQKDDPELFEMVAIWDTMDYIETLFSPAILLFHLPIISLVIAVAVLGPGWVQQWATTTR